MIGSTVALSQRTVRIVRIISEGGYGFVYLVEDEQKNSFALKKVITQDPERYAVITKELKFLQEHARGPAHPYFASYFDSKVVANGKSEHIFYILMEFGSGGTLFDIMARRLESASNFTELELIGMAGSIARALQHVHELGYVYCDMKIENCLFFDMNTIKLCDFGSVNVFDIDFSSLPRAQHYQYEEIFEKETTLMYRPPEMCDTYLQYRVNTRADMWMFGCVLYTLMFFKHPFFEASKLAITTASFNWPSEPVYSDKLEILVRNLLTPKPDLRPTSAEAAELLSNWQTANLTLNSMAADIKRERERKVNAIRHIGDGMPVKKVTNSNDLGFDVFDFSGLNKMTRKSHTPMNPPRGKDATHKTLTNFATPNNRRGVNLINDDVFNKFSKQKDDFNFFADEQNNADLNLNFEHPTDYNFDAFAEPHTTAALKNEFDDFLTLDVNEKKVDQPRKPTTRNDLDDLDFGNY